MQQQQNVQKYFLLIRNNYLYDTAASVKMQQNILSMKKRQTHHQRCACRNKKVNPPAYHGHRRVRDNTQSHRSIPSVHTPRVCCRAASPVLPAVPGCCRIRPPRQCSQWQGRCHPRTGLPPGWCPYCSGRKAACSW